MIAALFFSFFLPVVVFSGQGSQIRPVGSHNAFVSTFIAVGKKPERLDERQRQLQKLNVPAAHIFEPTSDRQKIALYKIIPSPSDYVRYMDAYYLNPDQNESIAGAVAVQIAGSLILLWRIFDSISNNERWKFVQSVCDLRDARIDCAREGFTNFYKNRIDQPLAALVMQGLCACDLAEGNKAMAADKAQRALFLYARNKVGHRLREFFLEVFFNYGDDSHVSSINQSDPNKFQNLKDELRLYREKREKNAEAKRQVIENFMQFRA